ncbi:MULTISPECIES: anthranilate synthase family protein [unclassified Serratia (in: enterobacteria)]|uniref:anthranilate synthase family protein n=1 Tax=unclassified Serratia (in: enterobacteria) TaxID=2647522 RepID=UPI0027ED3BE7|nr:MULTISPECIES: anthranilate synthase family protein [unclassified Serratia (in: enterobacteria)]MDQ7097747.1 anthranilate synthase family protein [Serratia sp. MF2]MDQ7105260.1 anthranilate synthase family protein [Serratia sp. MF1(2023)]
MNTDPAITSLLRHGSTHESFALLFRCGRGAIPEIEVITGEERHLNSLQDLADLPANADGGDGRQTLLVAPYRQIAERGYAVNDDGKPLIALVNARSSKVPLHEALALLPDALLKVNAAAFEPSDDEYADTVAQVIQREIGTGQGANFVIRRAFTAAFEDYGCETGLTLFKNLLLQESGAYWTFFIQCRDVTLIGASPERHITLQQQRVSMTPISGTYRYPATGPTREGLIDFLSNEKEKDELSMVLDEELKMMTRICDADVKTFGPFLTPMSRLVHTGYRLEGHSSLPMPEILRSSMFAPTVTGSPLENATRVIAKYESSGRGYYSGFAALLGSEGGEPTIDSAILIRTSEIDSTGALTIGLGATLVRTSDPVAEAAETRAKAAALQCAMGLNGESTSIFQDEQVTVALQKHNHRLAAFWRDDTGENARRCRGEVLLIDNEDAFTSMMEYQLRAMGFNVRLAHYASLLQPNPHELLVIGPGPGDPRDLNDKRVIRSRTLIQTAMQQGQPFIAICFGHQILCATLGYPIVALASPNQGIQKEIPFFDKVERVGFYNTFTGLAASNALASEYGEIRVARDEATGQIYGLRGPRFSSMQFHPESVLTIDGPRILYESIQQVVAS